MNWWCLWCVEVADDVGGTNQNINVIQYSYIYMSKILYPKLI